MHMPAVYEVDVLNMAYLPRWNTIQPNYRVHLPDRFIFFDTETKSHDIDGDKAELTLRLGVACYWKRGRGKVKDSEEWFDFKHAAHFWDWLTARVTRRKTLYAVAHNVPFDLLVLKAFSNLAARGWKLTRVYHRMTTTIVRFAFGEKRIIFIDTMNYYPVKLDELGEHVGLHKLGMPGAGANNWQRRNYCRRDVQIVKEAIARLLATLERGNLGSFKTTGPALAFNIFRHRYMKHTIRPHHVAGVAGLERTAYVGGYTMPFKLFERDGGLYHKLDVNSMYPSVMADNVYPTTLARRMGRLNNKELAACLKTHLAIARVTVTTEEPIYPLRANGHVFYPVGTFSTVLCSRGLSYALKHRHVTGASWALLYQKAPIFKGYVKALYSRKLLAAGRRDRAGALFYKMLLNGLYGKFGQRATETKTLGECDPALFHSEQEWHVERSMWMTVTYAGGSVRTSMDAGETRNSFPAIAAHVTEDARLKLFGLIDKAGRENVVYCDTDSLVVNGAGLGNLRDEIDPEQLGCLKVEKTGRTFVSLGKKDYLFGGERVLKGFKHPAPDFFFKAQVQEQFTGLNAALHDNHAEGMYVKRVLRTHNPFTMNVKVTDDLQVQPLRLPDDRALVNQISYLYPMTHDKLALWLTESSE